MSLVLVASAGILISYAHAQTVIFGSSNSTVSNQTPTFGYSNATVSNPTVLANLTQTSAFNYSDIKPVNSTICSRSISASMYDQGLQINSSKAVSLASENQQYLSKIQGYNSKFDSVFETWNLDRLNCKATLSTINVVYFLSNGTGYVRNLVMTLDPALSRINSTSSYVAKQYVSSSTNWSGYEFSADGTIHPTTQLSYSNAAFQIPTVSQPPISSNSKSCIYPSIGCDLAIWTGLEDQLGGIQNLAQGGVDANMTCISISLCQPTSYFLWYEFLPNQAVTCLSSNIAPTHHISATVSYISGKYNVDIEDLDGGVGCTTLNYNYGMTNPVFAPFVNERATYGSANYNNAHRDEIANFSPDTMSGGIGFSNTNPPISSTLVASTSNMINPPTFSGTPNINLSTISGGSFTESWLSSDNTNTCFPILPGFDWIVPSSCALDEQTTTNANVIIQYNSVLTIPNGLTLTMDFRSHHILINSGSGVLIQPGGKISN